MIFKSSKALNFLLENGKVATMRDYPYRVNQTVYIKRVEGISRRTVAKARIEKVVLNNTTNRIKYFAMSGFSSPEEWLEEAISLNKKIPRYIIVLRLIKKYI